MLSCSRTAVTIFWQPSTWVLITLMGLTTLPIGAPPMLLVNQHSSVDNTNALYHHDNGGHTHCSQRRGRNQLCVLTAHLYITDIFNTAKSQEQRVLVTTEQPLIFWLWHPEKTRDIKILQAFWDQITNNVERYSSLELLGTKRLVCGYIFKVRNKLLSGNKLVYNVRVKLQGNKSLWR